MSNIIESRVIENSQWDDAIYLCKLLYGELRSIKIYPALTGGCLYKTGERKDIDIVLYMDRGDVREVRFITDKLKNVGLENFEYFGYVTKCTWNNYKVDILLPQTMEEGFYE